MKGQLWVEPVGELIIARVRGLPTADILRKCHDQVLQIVKDTGQKKILYDTLEMETPEVEVPLTQWKLDKELGSINLSRAIVVPNTKLAYLARLAFADGEHRVFYNDMVSAIDWLKRDPKKPQSRTRKRRK